MIRSCTNHCASFLSAVYTKTIGSIKSIKSANQAEYVTKTESPNTDLTILFDFKPLK
ncbi:hypothetical protein CHCC20441_1578 [Bacillus licheniformis]|uniref:Uncharacterized protein n=1 Tax=Bacillus licheniformis TaxID=1402 RepID=A0A8B5Y8P7_BACLI|nr:hypothetical protein B4092_2512 [Bacillus licheniformis]TWN16063.1 hypothetical protein CHCC14564_0628 [Bacillus licheniformis LMG 17339]KYC76159.1 hypothetical protein B4090_2845 [Bacillus licheniformis]KYC81120.1 hypothetical protein B4091_3140 [Bacillus licheniformis]KYC96544.1 hypothetical protein B4164_2990 [Bacillus licheniformis]